MLSSTVCRFEHFHADWYKRFVAKLRLDDPSLPDEQRKFHRKLWEFCAIAQVLDERGMLQPGRRGLGFAVGQEPLPSLFAASGAEIVATDLATQESSEIWLGTSQHADSSDPLFKDFLLDRAEFEARVAFRFADMRMLSGFADAEFDFIWSSCSFEHLGSLEAGLNFVVQAMRVVKPGGLAVHTTEYNVSSNDATVTDGDMVIYRRRDIEDLGYRLRNVEAGLEPVDFDAGLHRDDLRPDPPPYNVVGRKHIKLRMSGFVTTSLLLVIRKG